MSLYVGDTKISTLSLITNSASNEDIINYIQSPYKINVVEDLGIVPNDYRETIRVSNAEILKNKICESRENFQGNLVFYFPAGEYHFNPIEIDAEFQNYEFKVFLIGETKGFDSYNIRTFKGVTIRTYGNFIIRTNTEGNNASSFFASDIIFQQNEVTSLYKNSPYGICFGCTENLIREYNFFIYNCSFIGYEKALYSPGYSCAGTRIVNTAFGLCKYGILIKSTCHTLTMERVQFNVCYRGATLLFGGDYCYIKGVHMDTSFHVGLKPFVEEDPRCYGIYCTGGLTIDGIYTEQYNNGENYYDVPLTYSVIDYEGNNYSGGGKLILKNAPITKPASNGGLFFRGANFQGQGELKIDGVAINNAPLRITNQQSLWWRGSVDFIRCTYSVDSLKDVVEIYGGSDRASGYVLDYMDIYGNGVAFTKHPIRGYKGSLTRKAESVNPKYEPASRFGYSGIGGMFYTNKEYDPKVLLYKGNRLPNVDSSYDVEYTGNYNCHVKGNIYVNSINNENVDVNVFMYMLPVTANKPFTTVKRINLFTINFSNINKDFVIPIDYVIDSLEYYGFMFGYEINKSDNFDSLSSEEQKNEVVLKMLQTDDEEKIIYEYEYIWDEYGLASKRCNVQQISLSSETLTLDDTTNTQQLTVTYYPTQTTQKGVDWVSSNEEVATVDSNGNVTKVGVGECVITATCNNTDYAHSATCNVTVS